MIFYVSGDSPGHVTRVVALPVSGAPAWVAVRFDDPARPWHRFGFRVRAHRFFFTLGDRQSDIWVADVGTRTRRSLRLSDAGRVDRSR